MLIGGLVLVPLLVLMGLAIIIAQAQATCSPDGDLTATSDAPGSLGGVLGTGVSREEIERARRHVYGGTKVVENQYRSTAYAPAAGGINCDVGGSCASTASGIVVNKGKERKYLIATNPQLNKYGALVYLWPNPYNWRGPFVVADTGGNFDGSDGTYRIDFYIWGDEDESKSNAWGNARMVKLSKTPIQGSGGSQRLNAQTTTVATRTVSTRTAPTAQSSQSAPVNGVKFRRPTSGPITSPFGQRWGRLHAGVDIAPPAGTPIVAALSGRVIWAGPMGGYGNYICIKHSNALTTCYAHQQRFATGIKNGSVVSQSQLIGYVGSTGNITGPNLHFEVRKGGSYSSSPTDPEPYLNGSESIVPADTTSAASAAACAGVSGGAVLASGLQYPLGARGKSLGGVAAHKARAWGNWQSDQAVDIGVPMGVPVYAVADARVTKLGGAWNGGSGNPEGFNVTLQTSDNQWFYTHLKSRVALRVGQNVTGGQLLGTSGAANGVNHLHIASMTGDPEALLGVPK